MIGARLQSFTQVKLLERVHETLPRVLRHATHAGFVTSLSVYQNFEPANIRYFEGLNVSYLQCFARPSRPSQVQLPGLAC